MMRVFALLASVTTVEGHATYMIADSRCGRDLSVGASIMGVRWSSSVCARAADTLRNVQANLPDCSGIRCSGQCYNLDDGELSPASFS